MKIAVWHNLPSGGGKRALYNHVLGLLSRGHQIEAWCPDSADDRYLPLSEIITEHRLPFKLPPSPSKLRTKLVPQQYHDQLLQEMNRHSQTCAAAILKGGFYMVFAAPCRFYSVPRLAHFLTGQNLSTALYLQEPARIRYEAMPELPWLAPPPLPAHTFFLKRWWKNFSDYRFNYALRLDARRELEDVKHFDLILVNSYFSRESIARIYGLDARVCYLSHDAATFHRLQPPPPRERLVVGLGSMHSIKGVATAIEAVAHLSFPRPSLIWVANSEDSDYRRKMENLAALRQVDFQVRHHIGDDALVDLLNRASLLLYTSHLEPFGYAPIEANACGTPVVAVAEGGIRETVVDGVNGFLRDRDPAALAEAMNRLLTDPSLAYQQGEAGVQMSFGRWSPEQSIDRLEQHLRKLLSGKQTPPEEKLSSKSSNPATS